jgi:hypothetical protein
VFSAVENRFLRLIEVFDRHQVRFIVVGGIAAVLQRVPVNTQDFDLLLALAELGATYRDDPRALRPNASHLLGPGNQLLQAGNLKFDVLGSIDWGGGYDDLLPYTELLGVGSHLVRVLTLEKLIEIKRHLPRPKDKLMLMHLEAALEERKKSRGAG